MRLSKKEKGEQRAFYLKESYNILYNKYFSQFYFYFANGINEILVNKLKSHVIAFKDYLFYDDDSEFIKRIYSR